VTQRRDTFARALHDLGLAAWFGGSLMGAVGVNRSAAAAARNKDTTAVAGAGWSAWTPVNLVAIGAPASTGALIVLGALMGEQQRSSEVARGVVGRVVEHLPGAGRDRHGAGHGAKDALTPLLEALPVPGR
jgi:hypothetical protein